MLPGEDLRATPGGELIGDSSGQGRVASGMLVYCTQIGLDAHSPCSGTWVWPGG